MNYRIVIKTKASGNKKYYIQKRRLIYFWRYLREIRDISMYAYVVSFDSLEEAKKRIQLDINDDYIRSQKKIVKCEYLYW